MTAYQRATWALAHAQAKALSDAHRHKRRPPKRAAQAFFRTLKAALTAQP